jgi:UDP-glucose 4-epimerase
MKILVTGGAGYVGSNLIKELRTEYKEATITSIDNYFTGQVTNHIEGVHYKETSTWDINKLDRQDVVYHFGEYSRVVPSFQDIEYLMTTNLWGTSRVLEQCKKWNAKLIYSASSSKFGDNENLSPYSWVKSKMVELIKNYKDWYGLKSEICYFYNVYGKNHINEGDYGTVIGIFEKQYTDGKALTIRGDGKQSRIFTHIDDIVSALIKVGKQNRCKEWHLSSKKDYTINEVAKMFSDNIEYVDEAMGERKCSTIMASDTEELLKWECKNDLKTYIKNFKNGTK